MVTENEFSCNSITSNKLKEKFVFNIKLNNFEIIQLQTSMSLPGSFPVVLGNVPRDTHIQVCPE